jgi:hypothetical protein
MNNAPKGMNAAAAVAASAHESNSVAEACCPVMHNA